MQSDNRKAMEVVNDTYEEASQSLYNSVSENKSRDQREGRLKIIWISVIMKAYFMLSWKEVGPYSTLLHHCKSSILLLLILKLLLILTCGTDQNLACNTERETVTYHKTLKDTRLLAPPKQISFRIGPSS